MSIAAYIGRSLVYYWRTHLAAVLIAAVAAAILSGALLVGDSMRASLRDLALLRLGDVQFALPGGDRFFRAALADELSGQLQLPPDRAIQPVMQLPASVTVAGGLGRANQVQLLGVGVDFWPRLTGKGAPDHFTALLSDGVLLNEPLARQLGVEIDEAVVLRLAKPSLLPLDAPLAREQDALAAIRLTVGGTVQHDDRRGIVQDEELGRFSLQASQAPALNAFVSLDMLSRELGLPGRANLLLVAPPPERRLSLDDVNAALRRTWQLADAQLELRLLPGRGVAELRTGRIFLEEPAVQAAMKASPDALPVLTYFVNELRLGERATPYSMVTALPSAELSGLADDEIAITQWLADDLAAKVGDELTLTYYVLGPARQLSQQSRSFRVARGIPMDSPLADRTLMPDFPGLAEAKTCHDWQPGVPIELERIRPKDEKYWEECRGTPKAFVTLPAGQQMWGNRFGNLTAIRFNPVAGDFGELSRAVPPARNIPPAEADPSGQNLRALHPHAAVSPATRLAAAIRANINPADVGLRFQDVRQQALAAATRGTDFGQLFLGFSLFLIVSAVMLVALLRVFSVQQRLAEVGTLLAVGFPPRQVAAMLLAEGAVLTVLGTLVGLAGGALYTKAMLWGLTTIWRGATNISALRFHASPASLAIAAGLAIAVTVLAQWLVLRRQLRRPARELLTGSGAETLRPARLRSARMSLWIGLAAFVAAVAVAVLLGRAGQSPAAFFGSGSLMLLAFLAMLLAWLYSGGAGKPVAGLWAVARRNAARRAGRSLAVAALLACGSFVVVAIAAFRQGAVREHGWHAGTGGFAFVGTTAGPILRDLDSPAGRAAYGLDQPALKDARVVPLRVHAGDDASCLNLNRAQRPTLLGVQPERLAGRFQFVGELGRPGGAGEWALLAQELEGGQVPAVADETTLTWGLKLKVGDVLEHPSERGEPVRLRIVGELAPNVLQGGLIIAERDFLRMFPSASGYRMLLIDVPAQQASAARQALLRALSDAGLELTTAGDRLAQLHAVEDTYLSIFQLLGALGLLLGAVGLGLVVVRNVLERRAELALMRAIGFSRRELTLLVLGEHALLLAAGLGIGMAAAAWAVGPALRTAPDLAGLAQVALLVAALLLSGLAWIVLAAAWSLHGALLPALRTE